MTPEKRVDLERAVLAAVADIPDSEVEYGKRNWQGVYRPIAEASSALRQAERSDKNE